MSEKQLHESKRRDDSPTDLVGWCGGSDRRLTSIEKSAHLERARK